MNYDFIIIGGGSSGAALASILSSKGSTLLIERGANHTVYPQSAVRQGWPQIAAVGYEMQRNIGSGHWTGTANVLGGGSALNGGACWRGGREIFEALGLDLDSVDEAFQHLEDRLCEPTQDSEYNQAFRDAWAEKGLKPINATSGYASWATTDSLLLEEEGTIQRARTILPPGDSGQRRRPASYLFENAYPDAGSSILDQGNLTVYLLTKAKRVIFDDDMETAIGVEVQSPSGSFSVYIRSGGKVFLNAGAYETPKLLMLSGIGPSETLSEFGIPVVHANEYVGKNLVDRKQFTAILPLLQNLQRDDEDLFDFAAIKKDYWSEMVHKYATEWGNVFQGCNLCAPMHRTATCVEKLFSGLLLFGINRRFDPPHFVPYYVAQRRPQTRGYVTLASADFNDAPIVYDGWTQGYDNLSPDASSDLTKIVDGVQDLMIDLIRQTSLLQSLGHAIGDAKTGDFSADLVDVLTAYSTNLASTAERGLEQCSYISDVLPENVCTSWEDCVPTIPQLSNDRDKLTKTVFQMLASAHHMSGTCGAGYVVEKGTLAVKGVTGLYISDLSVVTQAVDVHPMMTAMSLGVVLGNSVQSVPVGDYEMFPVLLSVGCTAVVLALMIWIVVTTSVAKSRSSLKREETHQSLQTFRAEDNSDDQFVDNEEAKPKIQMMYDLSIETSARDDTGSIGLSIQSSRKSTNVPIQASTIPDDTRASLMQWSDVSCTYDSGKNKKPVTTLFSNFGCLKEGEVTAIMGPSGASKSTLLDILAGRKSVGNITGIFSVLGQKFDVSADGLSGINHAIQGNSAYIPQQEYFYPTQTVEEAVAFAANMKFGRDKVKERMEFIHWCLDVVGLPAKTYASRKIGGDLAGGISIRGLSGGERKRLALASVLALKPRMMFIDELTSGLDSENTVIVMELLKELSVKQQVASMVIIHQPNPKVFALFDRLILLSRGRCMFSGSCTSLSTFYETNYDEAIPMNVSLADDLITKASAFDVSHDLAYEGEVDTTETTMPSGLDHHFSRPSRLGKLLTVFDRNLKNQYIRNVTNVGARLASYSAVSFIVGMIFWQTGVPSSGTDITFEDAGLLVRASTFLMNVPYLLPFTTIPVFVGDKRFFAAESALGLYAPWMYGLSQVFLEFAFVTLASTVQACIVIPMCALWNPTLPPWVSFLTTLAGLITTGLTGSTLVFCCSMMLPTQDLAFLLSSTIVTISLALCGGFLAFSEMPIVPFSIQWISPVKYSLQSLLIPLLTGTSAERLLDGAGLNTPATATENLAILVGAFITLSVASAVAMARVKEVR